MKQTYLLIAVCAFGILTAVSCKKKSDDSNKVRNELIGKWTETGEARDLNGNGQMDANETTGPSLYQTYTLSYTADGVLSILQYSGIAGKKSWSLEFNNTYLKTSDIDTTTNTSYQHIDNITSSAMTLKDTTQGTIRWYQFAKQ